MTAKITTPIADSLSNMAPLVNAGGRADGFGLLSSSSNPQFGAAAAGALECN